MKGDRVEIVIDAGADTRTYEVTATRAGRRVEISSGRGHRRGHRGDPWRHGGAHCALHVRARARARRAPRAASRRHRRRRGHPAAAVRLIPPIPPDPSARGEHTGQDEPMSDGTTGGGEARIGSAERDSAVAALRTHLEAGRLTPEEYEDRSVSASAGPHLERDRSALRGPAGPAARPRGRAGGAVASAGPAGAFPGLSEAARERIMAVTPWPRSSCSSSRGPGCGSSRSRSRPRCSTAPRPAQARPTTLGSVGRFAELRLEAVTLRAAVHRRQRRVVGDRERCVVVGVHGPALPGVPSSSPVTIALSSTPPAREVRRDRALLDVPVRGVSCIVMPLGYPVSGGSSSPEGRRSHDRERQQAAEREQTRADEHAPGSGVAKGHGVGVDRRRGTRDERHRRDRQQARCPLPAPGLGFRFSGHSRKLSELNVGLD